MRGSEIIVSSQPRGKFKEGILSGALLPGTLLQIAAGTPMVAGRFTWGVYNPAADGDPRLCAVLLPDSLQGQLVTTAYVSGARCFIYCPLPGDEVNVLVAPQVGTGSANAYTIGERLMPQHGTGELIAEATSANPAWFQALEHIDITANQAGLVWCMKC